MSINFNTAAASAIYKQRYTDKQIETIFFQSQLVGDIPKDPNYGGAQYNGAIRNGVTTARSASDATAFTAGSPSSYKQWNCAWVFDYASANITGAVIDQANGNANAMVDALVSEFDGAFIALGISLGAALYGNGGGAIGQISSGSTVSTATITLAIPSQIVNFQVNQVLQSASDDGTGGAGVRSGTVTILGVDVNAGTITATGNWNAGIAAIATSDYLFNQGDYASKVIGLGGWIPANPVGSTRTISATPFNGVNRSVDPVRLAGVAYSGNGATKSETLIQAITLQCRMGARKKKTVYCNPIDYADLVKEMQTRIVAQTGTETAQVGFGAVEVSTPFGTVTIKEDVFCPQGFAWSLQIEDWLLPSMGKVPKVLGKAVDGLEWLRVGGADAYQSRFGYRCTSYCAAPGWQCAITW